MSQEINPHQAVFPPNLSASDAALLTALVLTGLIAGPAAGGFMKTSQLGGTISFDMESALAAAHESACKLAARAKWTTGLPDDYNRWAEWRASHWAEWRTSHA